MTNLALAIEAQLDEQERAKQPITPKPETGSQKVCPNCNSNIPNNAKFCPNCGGKQPENVKKYVANVAILHLTGHVSAESAEHNFKPPASPLTPA